MSIELFRNAYQYTKLMYKVYAVTKLAIPETIHSGITNVKEIAQKLNLHEDSLRRVMRALAAHKVFTKQSDDEYLLNENSEILLPDHPQTMKYFILFKGSKWYTSSWSNLDYSVKTGQTAFDDIHGMGTFDYFSKNPEAQKEFHDAIAKSPFHKLAAEAYDFSVFDTIIDIGGGSGTLIASILNKFENAKGGIFDLPSVEIEASENISKYDLQDRCDFFGGSFFETVPNADAYLLSRILHDWTDEESIQILKNCRKAISKDGRLFLIEFVIEEATLKISSDMDIEMLVMEGGKERTQEEFENLFNQSGFKFVQKTSLAPANYLIEAQPI